jgi:hypothetical protein
MRMAMLGLAGFMLLSSASFATVLTRCRSAHSREWRSHRIIAADRPGSVRPLIPLSLRRLRVLFSAMRLPNVCPNKCHGFGRASMETAGHSMRHNAEIARINGQP